MSNFNWKSILITIIAVAVGRFFGANLLFPAVAGLTTYWVISKFGSDDAKKYQTTLAFIAGQTGWMIAGFLMTSFISTSKSADFLIFDIAVGVGFILMLIINPKKWVFIAIFLYEILSVIINISEATKGTSQELRALGTHIAIRVGIIISLFIAMNSDKETLLTITAEQSKERPSGFWGTEKGHLFLVIIVLIGLIGSIFFYLRGTGQEVEDCSMTWNGARFVSGYPANKTNYDSMGITNTTHTIYFPKNINQEDFLKILNSSTDEMRKICPF